MTRTDQAFIEAYQRAAAAPTATPVVESPAPTVETPSAPQPKRRHNTLHGPHATFAGKTPLNEAIAERMRQAAASMAPAAPECVTQIETFRWSPTVETLAEHHKDDYLAVAQHAISLGRGSIIGFAGVHDGSGASTTILATARSLAAEHGPIAIVDADLSGGQLSSSLGVLKTRTLANAVASGGGLAESAVYAANDRVSLVVAGDIDAPDFASARVAAEQLARQHALVLVDFGALLSDQQATPAGQSLSDMISAFRPAGIIMVRRESDLSGAVSAAQRVVDKAGATAIGLVENQLTMPSEA